MQGGFSRLTLHGWRQFDEVDLDFRQRLTVLTGANGAGKTTILRLLVQHFGWEPDFLAEPQLSRGGRLRFLSGLKRRLGIDRTEGPEEREIGALDYANGERAQALLPEEQGSALFPVVFRPRQALTGVFVPSNRPHSSYERVDQIPTTATSPDDLIENYEAAFRNRWSGSGTPHSPTYRLKESLIALATFGYGSRVVRENREYVDAFEGFQAVLRRMLPRSLQFDHLQIASPEVILETGTGSFSLDAVSGGVATLIDLAWRIYMRARTSPELVVAIDEPENHLHPELQRELLPGLLEAFPDVQLIAATHNPFIVGSVPDSNVYVLRYNDDGRVYSQLLDTVNKAGSSNEILRDVLGLEFTSPLWVEDRLDAILARYEASTLSGDSLRQLRKEMGEVGLQHLFPEAVSEVLGDASDQA